ncbi:uncharacterized protein LOC135394832 [Ornithodoros turicata]|uniref:uncharacterized protein LOC135394832 n=1 Tax=Ornithodoros turicata TaxID=34597 RepID=UPI003139071C
MFIKKLLPVLGMKSGGGQAKDDKRERKRKGYNKNKRESVSSKRESEILFAGVGEEDETSTPTTSQTPGSSTALSSQDQSFVTSTSELSKGPRGERMESSGFLASEVGLLEHPESFYEMVGEEIGNACTALVDHQASLVSLSSEIFNEIPLGYRRRRYANPYRGKCSGRCCDHPTLEPKSNVYRPPASTMDATTLVELEEFEKQEGTSEAVAEGKVSLPSEPALTEKMAAAAREAKKAIEKAKAFQQAARTLGSLEESEEMDSQTQKEHCYKLMRKAAAMAKKARDALNRYSALKATLAEIEKQQQQQDKTAEDDEVVLDSPKLNGTYAQVTDSTTPVDEERERVDEEVLRRGSRGPRWKPQWYGRHASWPYESRPCPLPLLVRSPVAPGERPYFRGWSPYGGMFYADPYSSRYPDYGARYSPPSLERAARSERSSSSNVSRKISGDHITFPDVNRSTTKTKSSVTEAESPLANVRRVSRSKKRRPRKRRPNLSGRFDEPSKEEVKSEKQMDGSQESDSSLSGERSKAAPDQKSRSGIRYSGPVSNLLPLQAISEDNASEGTGVHTPTGRSIDRDLNLKIDSKNKASSSRKPSVSSGRERRDVPVANDIERMPKQGGRKAVLVKKPSVEEDMLVTTQGFTMPFTVASRNPRPSVPGQPSRLMMISKAVSAQLDSSSSEHFGKCWLNPFCVLCATKERRHRDRGEDTSEDRIVAPQRTVPEEKQEHVMSSRTPSTASEGSLTPSQKLVQLHPVEEMLSVEASLVGMIVQCSKDPPSEVIAPQTLAVVTPDAFVQDTQIVNPQPLSSGTCEELVHIKPLEGVHSVEASVLDIINRCSDVVPEAAVVQDILVPLPSEAFGHGATIEQPSPDVQTTSALNRGVVKQSDTCTQVLSLHPPAGILSPSDMCRQAPPLVSEEDGQALPNREPPLPDIEKMLDIQVINCAKPESSKFSSLLLTSDGSRALLKLRQFAPYPWQLSKGIPKPGADETHEPTARSPALALVRPRTRTQTFVSQVLRRSAAGRVGTISMLQSTPVTPEEVTALVKLLEGTPDLPEQPHHEILPTEAVDESLEKLKVPSAEAQMRISTVSEDGSTKQGMSVAETQVEDSLKPTQEDVPRVEAAMQAPFPLSPPEHSSPESAHLEPTRRQRTPELTSVEHHSSLSDGKSASAQQTSTTEVPHQGEEQDRIHEPLEPIDTAVAVKDTVSSNEQPSNVGEGPPPQSAQSAPKRQFGRHAGKASINKRVTQEKQKRVQCTRCVRGGGEETRDLGGSDVYFPETRLVIGVGFLCVIWVCYVFYTSYSVPGIFAPHKKVSISGPPQETHGPLSTVTPDVVVQGEPKQFLNVLPPRSLYVCKTSYCEQETSYLSGLFSGSACTNFYDFVCNIRTNPWLPRPGSAVSTDTILVDEIEKSAREYIQSSQGTDMKAARILLDACISQRSGTDDLRRQEMHDIFLEYFDTTWPVNRAHFVNARKMWITAGHLVRDFKLEALVSVSVDIHPEDRGSYIIGIDEPSLLYREGDPPNGPFSQLITAAVEQSLEFVRSGNVEPKEVVSIMQTMIALAKLVSDSKARYLGVENYRLAKLMELVPGLKPFLQTIFSSNIHIIDTTIVLVKSPNYFDNLKHAEGEELKPWNILNYLGFRVVVYFGAFLSRRILRELRAIELGLSIQGSPEVEKLCSRQVETVLSAHYMRAYALHSKTFHVMNDSMISELKRMFIESLQWIPWMESTRDINGSNVKIAKYKIRNNNVVNTLPSWILRNTSFEIFNRLLEKQLGDKLDPGKVLKHFKQFSKVLQEGALELPQQTATTRVPGSLLRTNVLYDVQTKAVYIPIAVINTSIPISSAVFVIHIARYGVRMFKGLVPALYQEYVYERRHNNGDPVLYGDGYEDRLRKIIRCLLQRYQDFAENLKSTFISKLQNVTHVSLAIFEQTLALMQSYWAFQELLKIKRVWRTDFRLLPQLSSDQLFFVMFALDNCEKSDEAYRRRRFETLSVLPPEDRVNFPLSQFAEFARAFACNRSSPMNSQRRCRLFA